MNPAPPAPGMPLPEHFTQIASPLPNPQQQMTVYHNGSQVASPPQMNTTPASPYPTPSSQSSMNVDSHRWQAFLEYERQQQQQQFSLVPPNMIAQQPAFISQGMPQQDSGYGSGQYETLGQQQGLPGQQPQTHTSRPGHKYGNVTASGNARVIRGNVKDPGTPNTVVRDHTYGEGRFSDTAKIFDGDVPSKIMENFWN